MDRCMAGVDAPATALNERFIPPHSKWASSGVALEAVVERTLQWVSKLVSK
jgi:hypothetical protein